MKSTHILLFALFACFAVNISAADPVGHAAQYPEPPMQGKPWTPSATKLPPEVVGAIKELFDQGMADPRGCEYREVEVADPSIYSDRRTHKVHAWVLPGDGPARFAVGWNGRVVPVVKIGDPVDLRKDFPLATQDGPPYDPEREGLRDSMEVSGTRVEEYGSLFETSILPIKVALLLRLGETDLAEGVWKKYGKQSSDPYLTIGREWIVSWYEWAVQVRMKGGGPMALQAFRALLPLQKAVEASAARRKLPFPLSPQRLQPERPPPDETSEFYFEELQHLPALLADQERRAKEPAFAPAFDSDKPAEGPERVTALIRDLELANWANKYQIHNAMVAEGDAAVEPLIKCLEEDKRLTLGIDLGPDMNMDFRRSGHEPWTTVAVPAYFALTSILNTKATIKLPDYTLPSDLSGEDRMALAKKFRDYWNAHKGTTERDRWFEMLKHDDSSPAEWLEAIRAITQRAVMAPSGWPDTSSPMRGEALRAKTNPSVSDLIVKRFNQSLYDSGKFKGLDFDSLAAMLYALAEWDGRKRAGDLNEMAKQFNGRFRDVNNGRETGAADAAIYAKRIIAGDPTAVADYAEWLSSLQPGSSIVGMSEKPIFRLMWEHPDDPAIRKAAEKMFAGRNAPWHIPPGVPSKTKGMDRDVDTPREDYIASLLNTPMLGIAAYRAVVLKALDDTTIIGYVTPVPGNGYSQNLYESYMGSEAPEKDSRDFRRCDYYASMLAGADVFPGCDLLWPEKKRDAAVAVTRKLLVQYGEAFRYGAQDKDGRDFSDDETHARPGFPKLDHPATPDDVARGRAIFSLKGTVRVLPLPLPLHAERPSSPQDVMNWTFKFPHDKVVTDKTYLADGYVWQAEEVLVDGKWQRYYGFAGRHQLEKVPAAEIEFRGGYPWVGVTPSLDGALDGPLFTKPGAKPSTADHVTIPDAPAPMTVRLRNRGDQPQQVPDALMLPAGATRTLPPGITLALFYSKVIPHEAYYPASPAYKDWGFTDMHFSFGEWWEVPQRKEIAVSSAAPAGPQLAAGASLDLMRFDLRDYFDISKPGSYRVTATFHAPGEQAVKSQEVIFTVVEKAN